MVDYLVGGLSLGVILFILGLIDVIITRGTISNATLGRLFRAVNIKLTGTAIAILLVFIGFFMASAVIISSVTGVFSTASTTDEGGGAGIIAAGPSGCNIVKARHSTIGTGTNTNWTFLADDTNNRNYFMDSLNGTDAASSASVDVNGTLVLTIDKAPSTGQECNTWVYLIGPSFRDQTKTTDDTIFDLFSGSLSFSDVQGATGTNRFNVITFQQRAYLSDASATSVPATTSSNQEITSVQFGAGEVQNNLGYAFNFDTTNYGKILKGNQVVIQLRETASGTQTVSSSDEIIFTWTLRKGILGNGTP